MVGSWYERKRPRTSQPSETFRFPDLNASSLAPLCSLNRELQNNTTDTVALSVINCKEMLGAQKGFATGLLARWRERIQEAGGRCERFQLHCSEERYKTPFGRLQDYPDCSLL